MYKKIMNVTLNNNSSSVIIAMEVANQASSAATGKTEESLLPCAVVEESLLPGSAVEESVEVSVVGAFVVAATDVRIHNLPILSNTNHMNAQSG